MHKFSRLKYQKHYWTKHQHAIKLHQTDPIKPILCLHKESSVQSVMKYISKDKTISSITDFYNSFYIYNKISI